MALTKCKECGHQVSDEAETCPGCGAKQPKPTSRLTWFFGALVVIVIASMVSKPEPEATARSAQLTAAPSPPSPPIEPEWLKLLNSKDPATAKLVKDVVAMKWHDQCNAWGREARSAKPSLRKEVLLEYLLHQNTINGRDLGAVSDRTVEVGMTACGVFASLGLPDDHNTTTTARSTSQQLVYRSRGMYVYTESTAGNHNGIVRAIQR